MNAALQHYQARMQRVLDHIDQHLDDDLDLDALAAVAAYSKFHFHRQFTATFGLPVHRYIQLARLKRAANGLAYQRGKSITDIAMDAGYDAPDAFARAFRQRFGQSPSSFRKSPDWAPWLAALGPFDNARSKLMHPTYSHDNVTIQDVPPIPVAMLEHRGDRALIGETIARFITWRKGAGLSPETAPTFLLFRSERVPENPADYSMDLCVGTELPVTANDLGVKAGMIPGGRCAVLRATVGSASNFEPEVLFLYRDWLPASGEETRDFPPYCKRWMTRSPDAEDNEAIAELYLPLK